MLAAPFEFMLLVWRNLRRHLLRSLLTVLGVGIALFAFCMIRTIVGGWYAGVEATAKNRMVVRNAVSIIFYLPLAYREAIARTPGVAKVGYGNWFGGIYVDKKNMVAQFAVDDNYLDLCPEYILAPEAKEAWLASRKGILAGEEFAKELASRREMCSNCRGLSFPVCGSLK
ncbi:MAG TPA: hypothetical protein PLP17_12780 [Oligoflexia bacterium]|nr:hypothetical protein [Oligoflexia bacterium]